MILIVDDEPGRLELDIEEIRERGHDVHLESRVDRGIEFIRKTYRRIDLLILDVMMPPGAAFTGDETHDGLRTGLKVLEYVRSLQPNLPVVVFTNVNSGPLEDEFKKHTNCWYLRKLDYLPFQFAEFVDNLLKTLPPG